MRATSYCPARRRDQVTEKEAADRLGRHHHHVACVRRHFLHQVSNGLVKTHDRLVIEDLNEAGILRNHPLAQAISDAGWIEFGRQLGYKDGGGAETLA
jgi:putative transposase